MMYVWRMKVKVKLLSRVRLFVTPWTVACTRLLSPWDFLGKSTGVGCHFLLQGIFPTQGSNPGLLRCRQMLYRLSHQGEWREAELFPGDTITNYHKLGVFKQWKFMVSQFWRPEVWNQNIGRIRLPLTSGGESILASSQFLGVGWQFLAFLSCHLKTKQKKVQCDSCELSFVWGKIRTRTWETAFQMALKNCSQDVRGKVQCYVWP